MRLFTGIDLPLDIVRNLESLLDRLRPTAPVKWSPAANLHITTRFIGEWPAERLPELEDALAAIPAAGAIPIHVRKLGLEKTAHIINGDILKEDYTSADLITVYLLPNSNDKVQPLLERELRKGARVVAHDFEFRNWTPEKEEDIEDDGAGRSHTLYLYRR